MKRTKKALALVLAMMMAFSIMAMTAAAYGGEDAHVHTEACSEEEIMPRSVERDCPKCHTAMNYTLKPGPNNEPGFIMVCPKCGDSTGWKPL